MMYFNQSISCVKYTKYLRKRFRMDYRFSHFISKYFNIISKYNFLVENSYMKLPKELDHPRKESINIQNINDNECFKWSIVRYLNPT